MIRNVVAGLESSGPSPWSIRHQTIENRHADKRAAALRRVWIVLVGPGPAGLWIISVARGGNGRAQRRTAWPDLHMGAVLRQPKALGVGQRRSRATERKKRHGSRDTKPARCHGIYFVGLERNCKPRNACRLPAAELESELRATAE